MKLNRWLGLVIGNSRLHWAYFADNQLQQTWNTLQVEKLADLPSVVDSQLNSYLVEKIPLYIASVVPSATKIYLSLPQTKIIDTSKIPLYQVYPTMGCDRILALWGAGLVYGFPCLVVDSGTALTFSGADEKQNFVGGAILPGVRLQLQSLFFYTASLPEVEIMGDIIPRWTNSTPEAIQSGVIYTIIAGIKDFSLHWLERYPHSNIIFTGGDAVILSRYFRAIYPDFENSIKVNTDLIFSGMENYFLEFES